VADVVGASSWTNAKFMAVGVDKNAVSRARGDGVEDVATPRLVAFVWACHSKGCCRWRHVSGSFKTLTGVLNHVVCLAAPMRWLGRCCSALDHRRLVPAAAPLVATS
jgi:hypothetical protein